MAADTSRGQQLQQLAKMLPQSNQQVQQGMDEARKTRIQAMARQAAGPLSTGAVQQMGAQQVGQQAAAQLQGAQQLQTQQTQVGQLDLQGQARQQRAEGFEQRINLTEHQQNMSEKIARLDRRLKNKLLDENLRFEKDEGGRSLFNQRQLMDYAIVSAQNEQEYQDYMQSVRKVHQRKMQVYKQLHDSAKQALAQGYIIRNKPLDREHKKMLAQMAAESQKKMQDEQARHQNEMAKWQAGGAIAGAVIGAMIPGAGPAGAAVGAQVGSGIATAIKAST